MRSFKSIGLSAGLLIGQCVSCLFGEIELVTLKWTPYLCSRQCVEALFTQLSQMPGVKEVTISQSAAQANLEWHPNAPFSYTTLFARVNFVGIYMTDLRVRVTGTISQVGSTVILTSMGDRTQFVLLGVIQPDPHRYVIEFNAETHLLTHEQRDQLAEIMDRRQIVTIEGPLFEPERAPPLYLTMEKIKVREEPKNSLKNRPR